MRSSQLARIGSALLLAVSIGCSDDDPVRPKPAPPVVLSFTDPIPIDASGLAGTLVEVVVADLNDDARQDLAVGMTDSSRVWVRFGMGGGGFSPARTFYCGPPPRAIAAANVTGGAINDLIVGGDGAIVVLRGLIGSDFAAPDTLLRLDGGVVDAIACADFDRDGATDIAVTVTFSGQATPETEVFVVSGLTRTLTDYFRTFGSVSGTGDFDGDQYPDLFVAVTDAPGILGVYFGKGDGAFLPSYGWLVGDFPVDLAVANLGPVPGDEIAVAHADVPGLWTLHWGTTQSIEADSTHLQATSASAVAAGDLNLDGRADFAVASLASSDVFVLANQRDGTLKEGIPFSGGNTASQIAIADIDGDGRRDILLAGPSSLAGIRYLKNTSQ